MSWVGRAQLARLLLHGDFDSEDAATLLGYDLRPVEPREPGKGTGPGPGGSGDVLPPPPPPSSSEGDLRLSMPVWREAYHRTYDAPIEGEIDGLGLPEFPTRTQRQRPLPTQPLAPWSELWPRLFDLLADERPGHAVDTAALVRRISAARPLVRLPRKVYRRWPERMVLWVDRSNALVPVWNDQDLVRRRLQRLCEVHRCDGADRFVAGAGDTVLLLGDVPSLSAAAERAAAEASNAGARLRALTVRPAESGPWRTLPWSTRLATLGTASSRLRRLMVLASTSTWFWPGMLRDLRRLLPEAEADGGTELDVWTHPDVRGDALGAVIDPKKAASLLHEFTQRVDPALQRRVRDVIRRWQAKRPADLRHIEAARWVGAGAPFDRRDSVAFLRQLASCLRRGHNPELREYARFVADHLAPILGQHPELVDSVSTLWGIGHPEDDAEVPEGIDARIALAARPSAEVTEAVVGLRAGRLEPTGVPVDRLAGSHGTWWVSRNGGPRVQQPMEAPVAIVGVQRVTLSTDRAKFELERVLPPTWAEAIWRDADGLHAEVDGVELLWTDKVASPPSQRGTPWLKVSTIERVVREAFDSELRHPARRDLVVAGIPAGVVNSLQTFATPAEQLRGDLSALNRLPAMPNGLTPLEIWLNNAFELVTTDSAAKVFWSALAEMLPDRPRNERTGEYRWRSVCNLRMLQVDEFGLYEDVLISGVDVRFRRIPAGRFLMGFADSDDGSFGDEKPQHHVFITNGFWLAETPTTQALWRAVTGENPSHFKGADRPVESVSWQNARAFIETVNQTHPELNAGLPTEAQWEYACRADTTASRYGPADDVAWHAGNSGMETHPVKQKRANPWGLYDMLGNVWEWCADWWTHDYTEAGDFDPAGPVAGAGRVIRGSSWDFRAGNVRAACRRLYKPDGRLENLGFRLSRGQAAPGARSVQLGRSTAPRSGGPRASGGAAVPEAGPGPRGLFDRVRQMLTGKKGED